MPFLIHQLSSPVSSSESSPTLFPTGHEKSVSSCTFFELQAPMKFLVPTTVVTVLKTCLETFSFMENHQKSEKTTNFHLEKIRTILTLFNWADDARTLPLSPTPTRPHASVPQPHTHFRCYTSHGHPKILMELSVSLS